MSVDRAIRPSGIARFAWIAWPFFAWLLPVFLVVRGFIWGSGGWDALFLLLASPVLVPVLGVLGMLPWFLLRRRGVRTTPAPLVAALFAHWWAFFAAVLALVGFSDSGQTPSLLRTLTPGALSRTAESAIFVVALVVAVATWVLILVLVIRRRPVSPSSFARWTALGWVAAFVVPAVLIGGTTVGVVLTSAQRDAAGQTVAEAASIPIPEQADRAEARYEEAQAMLSPLRAELSTGAWESNGSGWALFVPECQAQDAPCYRFEIDLRAESAAMSPAEAADMLRARGWQLEDSPYGFIATDDAGYDLEVSFLRDAVWVDLTSPRWWGDEYALFDELRARSAGGQGAQGLYSAEEWPPLL